MQLIFIKRGNSIFSYYRKTDAKSHFTKIGSILPFCEYKEKQGGISQCAKKTDTGMRATYSLAADADKISIQLPPETAFFGESFSRVFCRLMGVDHFTRIMEFHKETMTLEIIIPHVQEPGQFKYLRRTESENDLYNALREENDEKESVVYELWGDYVIPNYRSQRIGNLSLAMKLPHERDSSRSEHIVKNVSQRMVSKKAFAGIRLTYSFSADKDKIYIQLPPETPFFGGCTQRVYCRLREIISHGLWNFTKK
ncbi:MAG: hypothetical protein LUD01_09755 [Clostridiales bacterium]|nr:hypothetical protein [Clostridiales bacterium]